VRQTTVKEVSLESLNQGAIQELFELEWRKVVENVADPNTKPTESREITIKVKVKPDKARRTAISTVQVTSKLPGAQPHESFIFFERGEAGTLKAFPDDPGPQLEGIEEQGQAPALKIVGKA
jgi:hypothetical protein